MPEPECSPAAPQHRRRAYKPKIRAANEVLVFYSFFNAVCPLYIELCAVRHNNKKNRICRLGLSEDPF